MVLNDEEITILGILQYFKNSFVLAFGRQQWQWFSFLLSGLYLVPVGPSWTDLLISFVYLESTSPYIVTNDVFSLFLFHILIPISGTDTWLWSTIPFHMSWDWFFYFLHRKWNEWEKYGFNIQILLFRQLSVMNSILLRHINIILLLLCAKHFSLTSIVTFNVLIKANMFEWTIELNCFHIWKWRYYLENCCSNIFWQVEGGDAVSRGDCGHWEETKWLQTSAQKVCNIKTTARNVKSEEKSTGFQFLVMWTWILFWKTPWLIAGKLWEDPLLWALSLHLWLISFGHLSIFWIVYADFF